MNDALPPDGGPSGDPNENPGGPAPARRASGWVRVVLFSSLALNLVVVGLIVGAVMRGPFGGTGTARGEASFGRDLGLGPYGRALSKGDRSDLRKMAGARREELRATRNGLRAAVKESADALRAPELDPARLRAAFEQQRALVGEAQGLGHELLIQHLTQASPEDRARFAKRLERAYKSRRRKQ